MTLEAEFQKNRNADTATLEQLANQLSLPYSTIKVLIISYIVYKQSLIFSSYGLLIGVSVIGRDKIKNLKDSLFKIWSINITVFQEQVYFCLSSFKLCGLFLD